MYALLGYFNFQFFATVGESTDFLLELKLDKIKAKLSTIKNFQFYLLKDPYSELFENISDEKSGEPCSEWL